MTVTGLLFFVAFFAALLLAFVRHPLYGLWAYLAAFYLHPPSRWWGEFLPDLRWSLLAGVVTLLAMARYRTPFERQPWYSTGAAKIMIAFTAWFWLTTIWAKDVDLHLGAAELVTKYLLVYWMVYRLVDTPAKITGFFAAHLLGCFYLGYVAYTTTYAGRLDGVGGPGINDSNTLGMHLATGVLVGATLLLRAKGWRWFACAIGIAFAMNTIVMTGSRGAFLALFAGGVVLFFLRPRALNKVFMAYAVAGVLAFGYVAHESFWARIQTVSAAAEGNVEIDISMQSRLEMLKAQVQMALDNPLGAGQRGSWVLSFRYLDEVFQSRGADYESAAGRSSHNVFMTVLVEQGVPGALLMLAMILWVIVSVWRLSRDARAHDDPVLAAHLGAIAGSLMVVFVGGMFADFSKCEVQIWMFALLAAMNQKSMWETESKTDAAAGSEPAPSFGGRGRNDTSVPSAHSR